MGGKSSKSSAYEEAASRYSEEELRRLEDAFFAASPDYYRSRTSRLNCEQFMAFVGSDGLLIRQLFDFIRGDRAVKEPQVTLEDVLIAKARCERGAPAERAAFTFDFLACSAAPAAPGAAARRPPPEHVPAAHLRLVVAACVAAVAPPSPSAPAPPSPPESRIVDSCMEAAYRLFASGGQGPGADAASKARGATREQDACPGGDDTWHLTRATFDSWCKQVPSVTSFLQSLLLPGDAEGRAPPPRCAPRLRLGRRRGKLGGRTVVGPAEAWLLGGALPGPHRAVPWRLLYHSSYDGLSFATLHARLCAARRPTLLVLRDQGGAEFGGFTSTRWERRPAFYGSFDALLFGLQPAAALRRPSGVNPNFQWSAWGFHSDDQIPHGLGFGGQVGYFSVFLDANLESGMSRPGATYANECLASEPVFAVHTVECWELELRRSGDADDDGGLEHSDSDDSDDGGGDAARARAREDARVGLMVNPRTLNRGSSVLDRHREDRHFMQLSGAGTDHSEGLR